MPDKDPDSWRASGLRRRDAQHTHGEPEVPPHRRKRLKGSGKWCRRKPGLVHDTYTVSVVRGRWVYYLDICRVCGKHTRWWH